MRFAGIVSHSISIMDRMHNLTIMRDMDGYVLPTHASDALEVAHRALATVIETLDVPTPD